MAIITLKIYYILNFGSYLLILKAIEMLVTN